jgi:hypothetical protein
MLVEQVILLFMLISRVWIQVNASNKNWNKKGLAFEWKLIQNYLNHLIKCFLIKWSLILAPTIRGNKSTLIKKKKKKEEEEK